jgi:hypothetical protein
MRNFILAAAVMVAFSTAARVSEDGPFITSQWTSGLYAQRTAGPVSLFPNPASHQVNMVFPGLTGEATVSILAEDGRLIDQFQVDQTAGTRTVYNTDNLRNGAYLVSVMQKDGSRNTVRLLVANENATLRH